MAQSTTTRPTGFIYDAQVASPRGQRIMALTRGRLDGADPMLPAAVVDGFARDRMRGDVLSDAFVAAARQRGFVKDARRLVEQALRDGIGSIDDPPAELVALMEQVETTPEGLDLDRVERGAAYFRRFGVDVWHYYGVAGLDGYRKEEIFKPLALTGAYTGGSAFSRFLETCQFWRDISEPGAMRPGGQGIRTAMTVRIMHSMIRGTIEPHPEWDTERLGVPLNQMDQFATNVAAFALHGVAPLLGRRSDDADVLDFMYFWRYVDHYLGISPAFWPDTVDDWWRVAGALALCTETPGGDDARELGTSFIESYRPDASADRVTRARRTLLYWRQIGLSSHYLSPRAWETCDLPDPGVWRRLAVALQAPARVEDVVRRRVPALRAPLDRWSRRRRDAWLEREQGARPPKFAVVKTLAR